MKIVLFIARQRNNLVLFLEFNQTYGAALLVLVEFGIKLCSSQTFHKLWRSRHPVRSLCSSLVKVDQGNHNEDTGASAATLKHFKVPHEYD